MNPKEYIEEMILGVTFSTPIILTYGTLMLLLQFCGFILIVFMLGECFFLAITGCTIEVIEQPQFSSRQAAKIAT